MDEELFRQHAELETRHWWFRARREIVSHLVRRGIGLATDARVVDVGCGTGANVAHLAHWYRSLGIDPSPVAIQLARDRFPGPAFVQGSAPKGLPTWTRGGELFLLMDVLEHVADDAGLLRRLVDWLDVGSRLLITVPANPALWTSHDVAHGHHRRYELEGLASLLEGVSCEVELLSYFNSRAYPLLWSVRKIRRWVESERRSRSPDLWLPPAPLNELLYRAFRGEAARLLEVLMGRGRAYPRGLSLIAIGRLEWRRR